MKDKTGGCKHKEKRGARGQPANGGRKEGPAHELDQCAGGHKRGGRGFAVNVKNAFELFHGLPFFNWAAVFGRENYFNFVSVDILFAGLENTAGVKLRLVFGGRVDLDFLAV
jgi:hypothetical protein